MFCAATLGEPEKIAGRKLVVRNKPGCLIVRANATTAAAFRLHRDYKFSDAELNLASVFANECAIACEHYNELFFNDLAIAVPRKVIARVLGYQNSDLITEILDHYDELSNQTYERQRISAVVGLTTIERKSGVTLTDVWAEDFAKVLTSGIESMLAVDLQGRVYAHLVPTIEANHVNCPQHLRFLCEWTTEKQICLVLNRNGEILILKNKRLEFARRRGRWLHFAHEAILPRIKSHCSKTIATDLANKIHETCLDVSFTRCGGCIAVVRASQRKNFDKKGLVSADDLLGKSSGAKAKALQWLVTKGDPTKLARFTDLDRRFRQELAAIDGAMVIDSNGFLIAVGAIVKVPPGSASGARRAAARALAAFGIGIKMSADGEVSGFLKDKVNGDGQIEEKCIFKYG